MDFVAEHIENMHLMYFVSSHSITSRETGVKSLIMGARNFLTPTWGLEELESQI